MYFEKMKMEITHFNGEKATFEWKNVDMRNYQQVRQIAKLLIHNDVNHDISNIWIFAIDFSQLYKGVEYFLSTVYEWDRTGVEYCTVPTYADEIKTQFKF